ncbi:MAG: Roadblock/LC7 domain protein [bacterium ADurb.Bin363]|nr:MAG: Roadblock/LC7 domain protein [bacterium ADurb.Bin363]
MSAENILNEFIRLGGVVASLIVDFNGKILNSVVENFSPDDLNGVAELSSKGLKSAEIMGQELSKGAVTHSVIEYVDNVIAMEPVSDNKILVIVATKGANLGRIRYEVRKQKKALSSLI